MLYRTRKYFKAKLQRKNKVFIKNSKVIEGAFPKINTDLFCNKTKIGVMKSHLENYGLVLLKSDDNIKDKLLILDDYICKLKSFSISFYDCLRSC